ncbi:MAG: DUF115 domain-containing protein [Spirochaetales bacterium]|nr:DUF115 domain-containing protein [Spirochaetales bacterium]
MMSDWQVIQARNGLPTLTIQGKAIHSRFNPQREAQRTAQTVPEGTGIIVLSGFGLGYVAEALRQQHPHYPLVIAEAHPELLTLASNHRNLSSLLQDPGITWILGGEAKAVMNALNTGPTGSPIHLLSWPPSVQTAPQWYSEIQSTVEQAITRRAVNARTLERFGPLWVRNLALNTTMLPRALPLLPDQNLMAGIPALILAGGPSLEEALPHLPELAQRHLIIAVDTAVRGALRAGVTPDIIASVDPQYWNSRHLDHCGESCQKSLILAESASHPRVFHSLPGRPWIMRGRFPLGTRLENVVKLQGELKAGGSVATAAWDMGRHLGCNSLVAVGLDLAFPGYKSHYNGSLSHRMAMQSSSRTNPAELAHYRALHTAFSYSMASQEGGEVLTDHRMDIYATWFEESATSLQDLTPATLGGKGRQIQGMTVISLETLLSRPICRPEIERKLEQVRERPIPSDHQEAIQAELHRLILELKQLQRNAHKAIGFVKEAQEALDTGLPPEKPLEQLSEIDATILQGGARDLASFLIQPIIHELGTGEGRNPLEDSKRLYQHIAQSTSYHVQKLSRVL